MSLNKYGSRIYKLERLQISFRSCLYRKYGHQLSSIRCEICDIDIKLIIKEYADVMEHLHVCMIYWVVTSMLYQELC